MKKLVLSCLILSFAGLQSCKNSENLKETETVSTEAEKVVSTQCYEATYETDIIDLKLNILENGKVGGNMSMKVSGAEERIGEIKGEFHGDTLFADYTFTEGANKKTFKNPMAFLKKGKQLILGNGTMQTTMGVTYLVKDKPIDFERVKYKFDSIDCVDK
ncbi:hypothetical protein [Flavobacterium fluviatile]|uniref:hypothetical protein n=1 Tax=Flavobacterium fluviatile TaxID=1862387 RepID=UPI0013D8035F|nr:hypothetical protein [Flavobacterium fluviatile]